MITKNTVRFAGLICKDRRSRKKSSIITALLMDPEKSAFTVGKKIVSLNGNVRIAERNGSGSSEGEVRKASPFYFLKIEKKKNPCSVYSKRLMVLTFFW
jgi:hypothetical protein